VAKVGSTDAKKVMEAIKAGEWDTVIGKLSFDAKVISSKLVMSSGNGMARAMPSNLRPARVHER